MDELITLEITTELDLTRVDKALSILCPDYSRQQIQLWIRDHRIMVNDEPIKPSTKVKKGDIVTIDIPLAIPLDVTPEDIPLDIRFEDKDLLVINKPQGMVVHPANGHYQGTLVNALLFHCKDLSGINGVMRPGIVHRIDKDTSGLIMVAKNDFAHEQLSAQLKDKTAYRRYLALVVGEVPQSVGTIDAPIGRNPMKRREMAVDPAGKLAVTHFKVLERFPQYTLLECVLETGRTHQIRVHLSWIHYPVVGDPVYGIRSEVLPEGQLLHASILSFIHPRSKERITVEAPLPKNFSDILESLRTNHSF